MRYFGAASKHQLVLKEIPMFKTLALGLILASASVFSDTHFSSSISVDKVGIGEIPTEEVNINFMADVKKVYPGLNTVVYKNVRFTSSDEVDFNITSRDATNLCRFLGHGRANFNFLTFAADDYVRTSYFRVNEDTEGTGFNFLIEEKDLIPVEDLSCDIE